MKQATVLLTALLLFVGGFYFVSQGLSQNKTLTANTTDVVLVGTNQLPTLGSNVQPESNTKTVKQLSLSSSNSIVLVGEIGPEQASLGQEITEMAQSGKPIYLIINSPGGSVMDGNLIVSAIQSSPVPVYTICMQLCASMAAVIFETGTKRYMVDRSILMFHEAAGGLQGQFNQMKSRLNVFDRLVNKSNHEIAKRVGIDPDVFISKLPSELWLDAEDAVKQNYADSLVNLKLSYSNLAASPNEKFKGIFSQTEFLDKHFSINLK